MKSWVKTSLTFASALLAFDCTSVHALPTLNNGGFESPVLAPSNNEKIPNTNPLLFWQGSTGGPPSNTVELFANGRLQNIDAYEGVQFAEVQNFNVNDSISQSVSGFTVGGSYNVSFAHRGRAGTDTVRFEVKNGGSTIFTNQYTTDNSAWVLYSGQFVATASSLDLIFTGVTSALPIPQPGVGNLIDAVTLSEVPGPLPLVGAATAFAFSRRIRRRIIKAHS